MCVFEKAHIFNILTFIVGTDCIKGNCKGKGKFLPVTGHEDPEGEQMYSSILPSTSSLDWGGWSAPRPGRFTPRKYPVPIV